MRVSWTPYKNVNMQRVEELLQESFRTKQLTNGGPVVKHLEGFLRQILGINDNRGVITTCNATVALDIVARSFDLLNSKDNKWATQSFTFPSSAQVKGGSSTKIVDINDSHCLDLNNPILEEVDGLFVTTVFGNLPDISKYEEYATKHKKFIVFDSAATPYSFYKGENVLNRGHASVLSLHHTKAAGFAESGLIVTTRQLEPICRKLLNFGIDNTSFNPKWEPNGMNGKMSDVSASFTLSYLESNFDYIVSHHRTLYEEFSEKIKRFAGEAKMFPNYSDGTPVVPCLCVIFNKKTDHLIKMLSNSGIYSRAYYNPLDSSCYRSVRLHENICCLPCHTDINFEILDEYIDIIGNFLYES